MSRVKTHLQGLVKEHITTGQVVKGADINFLVERLDKFIIHERDTQTRKQDALMDKIQHLVLERNLLSDSETNLKQKQEELRGAVKVAQQESEQFKAESDAKKAELKQIEQRLMDIKKILVLPPAASLSEVRRRVSAMNQSANERAIELRNMKDKLNAAIKEKRQVKEKLLEAEEILREKELKLKDAEDKLDKEIEMNHNHRQRIKDKEQELQKLQQRCEQLQVIDKFNPVMRRNSKTSTESDHTKLPSLVCYNCKAMLPRYCSDCQREMCGGVQASQIRIHSDLSK